MRPRQERHAKRLASEVHGGMRRFPNFVSILLSVLMLEVCSAEKPSLATDIPRTTHDSNLYLFIDDHWIEKQQGVTRVYNQAQPLDQPIIAPDNPKTETDCAWGNVIREADGKFRLWYCTMTMGTTTPFLVGDEMLIYFNAFSRNQQTPCPRGSRSIGVAKLRRDGFVGVQSADKDAVGQLTTKPLRVRGDRLLLNVEQRGGAGEVTVALLDEQAAELPGFGLADSIPLTADAIRAPVQWKTQADLSSLRDKTVRVSLRLRGPAIVYALAIPDDGSPRNQP